MVNGFDWHQLVLPVLVLVIYDFGYVARMTRASMAEVMTLAIYPHRRYSRACRGAR